MNEQQRKKKLFTRSRVMVYGILGFVTTLGAAVVSLSAAAQWGCRHVVDPYIRSYTEKNFVELHRPVLDEVDSLKKEISDVKHDTKLTRYLIEASASEGVRARAIENMRRDSLRQATWLVR